MQFQFLLAVSPKEVTDLLVVDLQVRGLDHVLHALHDRCLIEDVVEGPRDHPLVLGGIFDSHHGVGLSAAGLPVGKNRAVGSLQVVLF